MTSNSYREKALEEYGEKCAHCGSTNMIVIHHRDDDRSNNDLDNLIPLCKRCHQAEHHDLEANSDELIISVLQEGRATRGYIIDETGLSESVVSNRLGILKASGIIRPVHKPTGIYELVDDPREA